MEKIQTSDTPPVRLAFRTSYLGDHFCGSQMQADKRTVEGEFVAACVRCKLFSDYHQAGFLSAGRTDRGVHSRGQIVAFTTSAPERAVSALNWQLPPDCFVTGVAVVPHEFHPRYDARSRTYRYYFGRHDLDARAMDRAAHHFTGTHDFSPFARVRDKNPVRTVISSSVSEEGGFYFFEVTAESFLWHMVRYMASALLQVGSGEKDGKIISARLSGDEQGQLSPAPPGGLILWNVDCGISFEPVQADRRTSAYLREQLAHHAVMGMVCRTLGSDVAIADSASGKKHPEKME
jgi:tRNA pseudouridine38-40 synthase